MIHDVTRRDGSKQRLGKQILKIDTSNDGTSNDARGLNLRGVKTKVECKTFVAILVTGVSSFVP